MSMPKIPQTTVPQTDPQDAIAIILASIGYEELGLAHILNAEGEKIQAAIGTLPGQTCPLANSISDLLAINKSVQDTIKVVASKELLLAHKLQLAGDLLRDLPEEPHPCPHPHHQY